MLHDRALPATSDAECQAYAKYVLETPHKLITWRPSLNAEQRQRVTAAMLELMLDPPYEWMDPGAGI